MRYAPAMALQLAALHQREQRAAGDYSRRVAQTRSTSRSSFQKENPMSTFNTVYASVQTVVVSLLINHRAQAVVALAIALVSGLLLGGDVAEARRGSIGGGPHG